MLYPHPEPLSLWQTTANLSLHRRRSNTVLWVLVCTRFLWGLWASLAGMGFDLNTKSPLLPSCWGFSFALGCGVSPHSCSNAHCLTGVSLTLDVGYLLTAVAPDLAPELQASGREWDLNTESYQLGRHLWAEVTWNFKWRNMKFCFLIQPVDWIHVFIDTFKLIHSVIKHLLSPYCISGTF